MMKTLCVAIVALSFTSVCQSATLACEKLLKPVDKGPDLSGRWYLIAMSSDICLIPGIINPVFLPSIALNITAKETPNIYQYNFKINMHGYCMKGYGHMFYRNNIMFDVDKQNAPTGVPDVLLQSECYDCLLIKGNTTFNNLMLFSRRQNVTADELEEFKRQADCLILNKPEVFNSDHEYENCKSVDNEIDIDASGLLYMIYQTLKNMTAALHNCLLETIARPIRFIIKGGQEMWESFSSLLSSGFIPPFIIYSAYL